MAEYHISSVFLVGLAICLVALAVAWATRSLTPPPLPDPPQSLTTQSLTTQSPTTQSPITQSPITQVPNPRSPNRPAPSLPIILKRELHQHRDATLDAEHRT